MLLLYPLARSIASGLSPASANNSTLFNPVTGECIDINGCRTTTGIIWSCLPVIFICTWVAIHPNVPTVEDWRGKSWHPAVVVYQNVELMVVALLVPELVILWAMRQREKAKEVRERFKEYGWGMTHGFFVIMGGFALYDGDKFCGYLWDRDRTRDFEDTDKIPFDGEAETYLDDIKAYHKKVKKLNGSSGNSRLAAPTTSLEFLVAKGYITLTEDDIKDNLSQTDVITKSIAIIQTTWFITQVIARAVKGLAITELEITTVGFAILNFGTYFLWWNKPLRVRHPVRVYWRRMEKSVGGETGERREGGIWRTCWVAAGAVVKYIYYTEDIEGIIEWILVLVPLPVLIPLHISYACYQILQDYDARRLAIPISSRLANDPLRIYFAVYGIAALFGAIHCIPWAFQFPTQAEQVLWRISAVAVAAAPVAMGFSHWYLKEVWAKGLDLLDAIGLVLIPVLGIAYTLSRIGLIVIAFTSLRDLPSSAYQTVQWTTFFPHIG